MKIIKLTEICNPKQWKTLSTEQLLSSGYSVYGANGKIGYFNDYNHENPTVMITCRGATCGAINLSEPKSWINGNAMCLDDLSENVNLRYLVHYLSNYDFRNVISGSAQPQITRENLNKVTIKLYDPKKQEEIANNLDKIKKIIEQHKSLLLKYDTLIKSRFIEMFGDPKINSSKLPTKKFIEIVKLQRGFDLPVQERNQNGSYDVYGSNGPLDKHDSFKVKAPGIVTGRSGTLGNVYYVMEDYWPLNTTLFSVDTHNNNVIYLKYLLELFDLSRFSEGAGVPTLNRNIVHEKEIIDVSLQHQNEFAAFVQQIDKSKFAVQKSLEKAETLYKSLMQEYFG